MNSRAANYYTSNRLLAPSLLISNPHISHSTHRCGAGTLAQCRILFYFGGNRNIPEGFCFHAAAGQNGSRAIGVGFDTRTTASKHLVTSRQVLANERVIDRQRKVCGIGHSCLPRRHSCRRLATTLCNRPERVSRRVSTRQARVPNAAYFLKYRVASC